MLRVAKSKLPVHELCWKSAEFSHPEFASGTGMHLQACLIKKAQQNSKVNKMSQISVHYTLYSITNLKTQKIS